MSNNRTAPAYQEYAANLIARFDYRTLTLPQRGLLYSMRLECWVNQYLPETPSVLARILGFDVAEVAAELPNVMPFFEVEDGRIFAPDLEAYRERIEGIRSRQSAAAKSTNAKRKEAKPRASKGIQTHDAERSGKRDAQRTVERTLVNLNPSLNPSPSQDGGYVPTTYVESSDWGDFTADPEQESE